MIMKNCLIREIFIIQKNPVMRNCLYREIFMTKIAFHEKLQNTGIYHYVHQLPRRLSFVKKRRLIFLEAIQDF